MRRIREAFPMTVYRSNGKCSRISWCLEPDGHDGYHLGQLDRSERGITRQRCAPPGARENSAIECFDVHLPQWMKDGLTISGPLPSHKQPSWWTRFLRWATP